MKPEAANSYPEHISLSSTPLTSVHSPLLTYLFYLTGVPGISSHEIYSIVANIAMHLVQALARI